MSDPSAHTGTQPILTATLRLLVAFSGGLLLGKLGDLLAWNQLENPWPYLGLLCPFLLGISVALTVGICQRDACPSMGLASFLAWIGFYLTFVVIAYQQHPYNPPQPGPSPADPYCSPCFTDGAFDGFLILAFFPVGAFVVLFIAFASSSLGRFVSWRRTRSKSR